ncbi:MAG: ABC transporter ATP-binding protein [Propionibacteriaceae bacterium]|nr:ABC transporter ATP-binding protein [Propionibacteriaceae bacterium]
MRQTSDPLLAVSNLTVRYRGFTLGPIDFQLGGGEFLSLIGTNGSGKTTLVRALLGLNNNICSGTVTNRDIDLLRRDPGAFAGIGYVTDSSQDLLLEFTAVEYFNYCRLAHERAAGERLTGFDGRVADLASTLDLPLAQRRPLAALSLGTRRKAQIVAALLADPALIILDEPFIGLDFIAARALEGLMADLKQQGHTCIVAGHDLDIASRLADRVMLLHDGRVLIDQPVVALGGQARLESHIEQALRAARAGAR